MWRGEWEWVEKCERKKRGGKGEIEKERVGKQEQLAAQEGRNEGRSGKREYWTFELFQHFASEHLELIRSPINKKT